MPRRPLRQDPKAGTDDHQVAHLGGVERIVQPQALCNLPVGRIPQHELSSANQNGDFLHCHGEPIEERLCARVAIQVDVGVRMSVARQESSNPQRIRAMFRPGDDDVAEAVCDQFHSSQDEGAHQDVAEFGIALDQPLDVRMIELNDFAVFARTDLQQGAAVREHVQLARELPGSENSDERCPSCRRPDYLNLSRPHDKERRLALPLFHEHVITAHGPNAAQRGHAVDLRRGQYGEDVLEWRTQRQQSL
jgi:hypothetical protein